MNGKTVPKTLKTSVLILTILTLCLGGILPAAAANPPATLAILPFKVNAPENLQYLREGIWDMLRSRLAWEGQVSVVDRYRTEQALKSASATGDEEKARQVAKAVGADHVLFGSVTALGSSVSLDATVLPLASGAAPHHFSFQSPTLEDVIPTINQLAQAINQEVFHRGPSPSAGTTVVTSQSPSTRNPEYLIPESLMKGQQISYLNPNFVEITPDGALRQSGLWRSQTIKDAVVSFDVADINNDGIQELVALTPKKVIVYRRVSQGLQYLAEYKGGKLDRFTWVAVTDMDGDKRQEILVTNIFQLNNPYGGTSERINTNAEYELRPSSFVLRFDGRRLTKVSSNADFFINAITLPKRGKIAVGQKPGRFGELFDSTIYQLQLRGSKLILSSPVPVPSKCNIFNFAAGDFDNDNALEYAVITADNRLLILDSAGNRLWRSRKRFGATTNYLIGKIEDLRYNEVEYYYIPSPILVMDLNQDGIDEIVVNRSPDYSRLLPQGFKYYEAGEIISMSWDQLGLIENWKTREVNGMVSCIRTGDLNGDGTPELIASLVLGKNLLKLWEAKSSIFSYDLNIGAKPKASAD